MSAFAHLAIAQVPEAADSDDRVFTTPNAVIVLDGASAFEPSQISGRHYAERLGQVIADSLLRDPSGDLRSILAAAISETARHLDAVSGRVPSSTVSIVRASLDVVDVLVLGDSPVFIGDGNRWERVADERIAHIALAERLHYRRRLMEGGGYSDEHRRILQELQLKQTFQRNIEGGYWIAEAEPQAARMAVTRTISAERATWAVLATDGAERTITHLGLSDWPSMAVANSAVLAGVLERCTRWEAVIDPNGERLPRAKRHDDKTLAALVFNKEIASPESAPAL